MNKLSSNVPNSTTRWNYSKPNLIAEKDVPTTSSYAVTIACWQQPRCSASTVLFHILFYSLFQTISFRLQVQETFIQTFTWNGFTSSVCSALLSRGTISMYFNTQESSSIRTICLAAKQHTY